MAFSLSYCAEGLRRLDRLRSFYSDCPQDRIFAWMEVPAEALKSFTAKYPPGYTSCPNLNERAAFWNEFLAGRAGVDDDSVPAAYLSEMDQGLYGGLVGGTVQFERWEREPVERILATFDGGVVHIHANGRHLLEAVSSLRGPKAIALKDEMAFPRAISVLAELKGRTGSIPLVVDTEFEEFTEALREHRLAGGVLYKVQGVPDIDTANRLMDRVREYRL